MPAVSSFVYGGLAALGLVGMKKYQDDMQSTQDRISNTAIEEARAQQAQDEKKMKDQEKKQEAAVQTAQARTRQRQLRQKYVGRTSTILTDPLGAEGATGAGPAPGTKTLLGV